MDNEIKNNSSFLEKEYDKNNHTTATVIGVILVIVLVMIVVGAIFFFESDKAEDDMLLEQIRDVSDSDELDAIERDIENTNIEALHREFEELEEEYRNTLNEE